MKKLIYLLVLIPIMLSTTCFGDIIPDNSHYVDKCVKITNVEDYPEIVIIGFTPQPFKINPYWVTSSTCLYKSYHLNGFYICAANKTYIAGKDINKIDLVKDVNVFKSNIPIEPYKGYVIDTNPISGIEQYYKIVGFNATSIVLHKWKEVNKFNNGKPDSTSTYIYNGEISELYQKIQVGINSRQNPSIIDVFPNPAQKNFHLKMNISYHGSVGIQIINLDGKLVKSQTLAKTAQILDTDIHVENLAVGTYNVSIKFGEVVETKKIVIK